MRGGEKVQQWKEDVLIDLHEHVHQGGVRQKDDDLLRQRYSSEQTGFLACVESL